MSTDLFDLLRTDAPDCAVGPDEAQAILFGSLPCPAPARPADPLRCACGAWGLWGFTGSTLAGTAGPRFCTPCAVSAGKMEPLA